jgi:aminotransferase
VGAAAPLQQAGAIALALPDEYYTSMASDYAARRDTMLEVLEGAGFRCSRPRGAYYIMTDIGEFGYPDDTQFVHHLIKNVGVAAVPGSSFFEDPRNGHKMVRFCFCKKYETLKEAQERLRKI